MGKLERFLQDAMEREKQDLRELRLVLERVSRVVGDFRLENKASWPGFAERVLAAALDGGGLHDSVSSLMEATGRKLVAEDLPLALHHFDVARERNVIFERGETRAWRTTTTTGEELVAVCYHDNTEWDLYLRPGVDRERVFAHLSRMLWRDHKALRLDLRQSRAYGPGEVVVSTIDLTAHNYIGRLSSKIEEWAQFARQGIRRAVLLQGKPGSGKSTLCLHAAQELGCRTVLVAAGVFELLSVSEWRNLMKILAPQVLILDDIDRVGALALGSRLEIFEERYCSIPFVFFTSNSIDKIPDAFRRPGRIDQILLVEEPNEAARRRMVRQFGVRLAVEIPEEQEAALQQMILTHSGAHVVEAIKRGKVLGWEHDPGSEDITFRREGAEDEEGDDDEGGDGD